MTGGFDPDSPNGPYEPPPEQRFDFPEPGGYDLDYHDHAAGMEIGLVLFVVAMVAMVVALAVFAPPTPDPADRARQLCAPATVHAWSYERRDGTLAVACTGGRLAWE